MKGVPSTFVLCGLEYCCVGAWLGRCWGVGVGFAAVYVCRVQSGCVDLVCLGYVSVFLG